MYMDMKNAFHFCQKYMKFVELPANEVVSRDLLYSWEKQVDYKYFFSVL